MTITSSLAKSGPYLCNGSTAAFTFGFACQSTSDVSVVKTDANAFDASLSLGADFTVALNPDQVASPGGTVTLAVAPASGYQVTVLRSIQLTQATSLPNQGGWYPKVVENALDKITMALQQLSEKVSRAVTFGVTQSDATALLNSIMAASSLAAQTASNAQAASTSAAQAASSATQAQNVATAMGGPGLTLYTYNAAGGF